jgi:hypothetical protein
VSCELVKLEHRRVGIGGPLDIPGDGMVGKMGEGSWENGLVLESDINMYP